MATIYNTLLKNREDYSLFQFVLHYNFKYANVDFIRTQSKAQRSDEDLVHEILLRYFGVQDSEQITDPDRCLVLEKCVVAVLALTYAAEKMLEQKATFSLNSPVSSKKITFTYNVSQSYCEDSSTIVRLYFDTDDSKSRRLLVYYNINLEITDTSNALKNILDTPILVLGAQDANDYHLQVSCPKPLVSIRELFTQIKNTIEEFYKKYGD